VKMEIYPRGKIHRTDLYHWGGRNITVDKVPAGLEGRLGPMARDRRGAGECYLHGPFLGDMMQRQVLRMKREPGGNREIALMPDSDEDKDAYLAEDIYAFIRRTLKP